MRRAIISLGTVALAIVLVAARPYQAGTGLDDEGFITTWLILAPIPLEANQGGADALKDNYVKDEEKLMPKNADKLTTTKGKELTWVAYKAKDYFCDFNDFLGGVTEDSLGYAVCYVHADKKLANIKLKTGSDDQCRVYLNGKLILSQESARALEKDQETSDVTLEQGQNVLVFKVVNEKVDWSCCARFVDKDGAPIKSLKITTSPK